MWSIRKEGEGEGYEQDIYRVYPDLFCLKFFHGGVFSDFPDRVYENGKIDYVDLLNREKFCISDLFTIAKEFGYVDQAPFFHYLIPGDDLDFGLRSLNDHFNVVSMLKHLGKHWVIYVYMEVGESSVKIKNDIQVLKQKKVSPYKKEVIDAVFEGYFDEVMNPNTTNEGVVEKGIDKGNEKVIVHNAANDGEKGDEVNLGNEGNLNEMADGDQDESDDDIVDPANVIDEEEVDMKGFNCNLYIENKDKIETNQEDKCEEDLDTMDSDSIGTSSSGEDIERKRKRKLKMIRKKATSDGLMFYVGQEFGNREIVKQLVKRHAVETRRQLKLYRNDKERVRAVCVGSIPQFLNEGPSQGDPGEGPSQVDQVTGPSQVDQLTGPSQVDQITGPSQVDLVTGPSKEKSQKEGGRRTVEDCSKCPWVLYVAKLKTEPTWVVQTYNPQHKCLQTRSVRAFTASWISKEILFKVESNPTEPINSIQKQMQRKYELGVSKMKAFWAKSYATKQVMGDYIQQYAVLRDYILELQRSNPGTTVKLEFEPEYNPAADSRIFKRIYICLGPLKQGFKACRREILGLDGTFLKGPFPGQLLTAVGVDPNNGIYPLAYAIVEAETLNSWEWFLEYLRDDLDLDVNSNFTFISDRQKGLIPALQKMFPSAEHRYCVRHIHQNMKLQWRGKAFKDMLWSIATVPTIPEFNSKMEELKVLNMDAYQWLQQIPPIHWARSHFTGRSRSDLLLNNLCEVFNGKLVEGRDKPVITLLEYVREYLMRMVVNVMRVIDKTEGLLTPKIAQKFEYIKKAAAKLSVQWNGGRMYQVTGYSHEDNAMEQYVVDVVAKECSCRRWELTGIPCKHAVATNWNMASNGQQVGIPEAWIDRCYRLDTWKEVYSHKVVPINGCMLWPRSDCPIKIREPNYHKPIGRPRKMKKKDAMEKEDTIVSGVKLSKKGKTVTCSKCGQKGHNKSTCKGQRTEKSKAGKGSTSASGSNATGSMSQAGKGSTSAKAATGSKVASGSREASGSRVAGVASNEIGKKAPTGSRSKAVNGSKTAMVAKDAIGAKAANGSKGKEPMLKVVLNF